MPSVETSLRVSLGVPTVQASASRARRAFGRSDIAAKSVTPRRWIQREDLAGVEARRAELDQTSLRARPARGRRCPSRAAVRGMRMSWPKSQAIKRLDEPSMVARPTRPRPRWSRPSRRQPVSGRRRIEFRVSMIRRELHPTGLRLVTEAMPHVRSVSIGVWLTRGSRHESDARQRHRPLRRAHALQGHRGPLGARTSRRRSTRSAATSTPSRPRNTPATTSRSSTSTCRKAVDLLSDIVRRPRFAPDDIEKREEGDPRRDQDGRGHPRRSGPRDLHRAVLARPSARTPDPRRAGDGRGARPRRRSPATSPRPTSPRTSSSRPPATSSTTGCRR